MSSLGAPEIIIIVFFIILLFGAKKLPELARSVGRSMRIFKSEVKEMTNEDEPGNANQVAQGQLPQAQSYGHVPPQPQSNPSQQAHNAQPNPLAQPQDFGQNPQQNTYQQYPENPRN